MCVYVCVTQADDGLGLGGHGLNGYCLAPGELEFKVDALGLWGGVGPFGHFLYESTRIFIFCMSKTSAENEVNKVYKVNKVNDKVNVDPFFVSSEAHRYRPIYKSSDSWRTPASNICSRTCC